MSTIDTTDFRARLNSAFRDLRKSGFVARQNFTCCQSCGLAALPKGTENYAFYHRQDAACLRDARKPDQVGVHLAWGGDGEQVAAAMRRAGLTVDWNGSESRRIWVCEPVPPPAPIDPDETHRARLEQMFA